VLENSIDFKKGIRTSQKNIIPFHSGIGEGRKNEKKARGA
jgi:hypothetical protein